MPPLQSHVRAHRVAKGLKQDELAGRIGLSRQSLGAIELAHAVPSTDVALAIADALECRVDDLFSLGRGSVRVGVCGRPSPRLVLANIRGRWVGHGAGSSGADALRQRGGKARLLVDQRALRDRVLIAGCAPGLAILASQVPGVRWIEASSAAALRMLARDEVHVAGAHLLDDESGEFNVAFARRALGSRRGRVFTLGRWEMGLVVAAGNPKRLRRAGDLTHRTVRVVQRPSGSGAAALLERWLDRAGVPASALRRIPAVAGTHADIAAAVKFGAADAGVAVRSVSTDLGFVPLAEERFDLIVPEEHLEHAGVRRLLEVLPTRAFREELAALPGHSVRESGRLVAQLGG